MKPPLFIAVGLGLAAAMNRSHEFGNRHSLAIRADGTVAAWGNNWDDQIDVPPGLSNAVAVAGGAYHSLALRSAGTVVAWGISGSGIANNGQ